LKPSIPIFDSLSHPTLTGAWLDSGLDASFSTLEESLVSTNFNGACAVGLHNVEDYDHLRFIAHCKKYPKLVPIAGVSVNTALQELTELRSLGFKGIKVHPRYSNISLDNPTAVAKLISNADRLGLVTFFCTYNWGPIRKFGSSDSFLSLINILKKCSDARVVLVHGGGVDILRYSELVRFNPNLLLDLSLTFLKYEGSSIDLDIQYLFKRFDRRICIGTDHPEYSHLKLREKFQTFSNGLSEEKIINIAHRNIMNFLNIP
jgi:predicted TIM-barrel fold metal-dependent hydrolase